MSTANNQPTYATVKACDEENHKRNIQIKNINKRIDELSKAEKHVTKKKKKRATQKQITNFHKNEVSKRATQPHVQQGFDWQDLVYFAGKRKTTTQYQIAMAYLARACLSMALKLGWNCKVPRDDTNTTQGYWIKMKDTFKLSDGSLGKVLLMGTRIAYMLFTGMTSSITAGQRYPSRFSVSRSFGVGGADFVAVGNRLSKQLFAFMSPDDTYCVTPSMFSTSLLSDSTGFLNRVTKFPIPTENSSLVTYQTRDQEGNTISTQRILSSEGLRGGDSTIELNYVVDRATGVSFEAHVVDDNGIPISGINPFIFTVTGNVHNTIFTRNWQTNQNLLVISKVPVTTPGAVKIVSMSCSWEWVHTSPTPVLDTIIDSPTSTSWIQMSYRPLYANPLTAKLVAGDVLFTNITAALFKNGAVIGKLFNNIHSFDPRLPIEESSAAGRTNTIGLEHGDFSALPFNDEYKFETATDIDNIPVRVLWFQSTAGQLNAESAFSTTTTLAIERPTKNPELTPTPPCGTLVSQKGAEGTNSDLSIVSRAVKNVQPNDIHESSIWKAAMAVVSGAVTGAQFVTRALPYLETAATFIGAL